MPAKTDASPIQRVFALLVRADADRIIDRTIPIVDPQGTHRLGSVLRVIRDEAKRQRRATQDPDRRLVFAGVILRCIDRIKAEDRREDEEMDRALRAAGVDTSAD